MIRTKMLKIDQIGKFFRRRPLNLTNTFWVCLVSSWLEFVLSEISYIAQYFGIDLNFDFVLLHLIFANLPSFYKQNYTKTRAA